MSTSRNLHAAWRATRLGLALLLAAGAARAAQPPLPETLDAGRVVRITELGQAEAGLRVQAAGSATRLEWSPGAVWSVELQDGTSRFLSAGRTADHESEGVPLLPRESRWMEIPPRGEVHLVVEEVRLAPLSGLRAGLGRAEELANTLPDGDRMPLENSDPAAAGLFRQAGFDKPVLLGEPVIFRDLRMVSLSFHPVVHHDGQLQRVESLRLRLEPGAAPDGGAPAWTTVAAVGGNEQGSVRPWSANMERIYRDLVPNHGQFYSQVDESVFPVYLVTGSPDYLDNPLFMAEFVKWKRQKGFDVRVVPFDQIPGGGQSISFGALRNWVSSQWQELRPEYLLLVGDVDGAAACPDSVVQAHTGDYDVSDHFYACQSGDDYFPEIFVGRFSVDNPQQLYVVAGKPVVHETNPTLASEEWLTHGLVVSCNFSDTGTPPISPNETSRWVIDKMRANGFTILPQDSLFFPPLADGGAQVDAALNQGRGIVSYRGWANSNGWIYPAYDRADMEDLHNNMMMPIVGSFVCQTGAFGQGSGDIVVEDPCFGEKFVRLGNAGEYIGAVAFVGPSDLHTRTQYNNPVCSGFFNAIFDLDMTSIGPALLNGKMELYNGYPLEREDRFSSYFYFHIYNVLGDPDLKIWRAVPQRMELEAQANLLPGQTLLEVEVNDAAGQPVDGAVVTLTAGDDGSQLLARAASRAGHALLALDPARLTSGLATVLTADHIDHMPAQLELSVVEPAAALELVDLVVVEEEPDGQYLAGESLEIRPTLANRGTGACPAGTAALRDPATDDRLAGGFSLVDGACVTPALASGAQATVSEGLRIRLDADVEDEAQLHLLMDLAAGAFGGVADGRLAARNVELSLVSASWRSGAAQLLTDVSDTLDLVLANSGALALAGASVTLESLDERVVVDGAQAALASLPVGQQQTLAFVLHGGAGLFSGQQLHVLARLAADGRGSLLTVPLPVGPLQPEDPHGPDAHGYYAIESDDYDVRIRPEYDYIELDPAYGGSGAIRLPLTDDAVTTIDLPFPVTHYGRTSQRLSICSNGWVCLGDTWISDFRNWNLPSSLGPPNLIAAYWDDLKPQYVDGIQDSTLVPVFWRHDAAEGRVVIAWSRTWNRANYGAANQPRQEFELVLFDQAVRPTPTGDTEILVQWKDVTDLDDISNYATCGMENFGHDIGLQVSFANAPSGGCRGFGSGRSVLFTTRQPLHDSSYRVQVQQPQPGQWLATRQPVFRWDHSAFSQLVAGQDVSYRVQVKAGDATLVERTVEDAGTLDLAALGVELPEQTALTFELTARVEDAEYVSTQGRFTFHIDATAPGLTPAQLRSGLYPDALQLGVLSDEVLASLEASMLDAAGATVGGLSLVDDAAGVDGVGELRYLGGRLLPTVATLRLDAVDTHGLATRLDLPLAAAPASALRLELPAAVLSVGWSGGNGWAVLLGQGALDARLGELGDGMRAVDLRLPAGAEGRLELSAAAGWEVVQRRAGRWLALPQERTGGRLVARVDGDGPLGLMREGQADTPRPDGFVLLGNHPNPFNPETRIAFALPEEGAPRLSIYNVAGARLRVIEPGPLPAGTHEVVWNGCDEAGRPAASGLYLVRIEYAGAARTGRMMLVR